MVKLKTIAIDIMGQSLTITSFTGTMKADFQKKNFGKEVMKYIEDYITRNEFEVINAETNGNIRLYHLIKKS